MWWTSPVKLSSRHIFSIEVKCGRWRVILLSRHWSEVRSTTKVPEQRRVGTFFFVVSHPIICLKRHIIFSFIGLLFVFRGSDDSIEDTHKRADAVALYTACVVWIIQSKILTFGWLYYWNIDSEFHICLAIKYKQFFFTIIWLYTDIWMHNCMKRGLYVIIFFFLSQSICFHLEVNIWHVFPKMFSATVRGHTGDGVC